VTALYRRQKREEWIEEEEKPYPRDCFLVRHAKDSGGGQVDFDIAIEEWEAQRDREGGSPVLDEGIRNETLALIRDRVPPAVLDDVLSKLESNEWTGSQARDVIAKYIDL
jgi:hypothetical protein